MLSDAASLFDRYYFGRKGFVNGTERFHHMCASVISPGSLILEIGAGSSNATSDFLAARGELEAVDVSDEVLINRAVRRGTVYDGRRLPYSNGAVDACVSNYVLEHVEEPELHFSEVARVLRPGGAYAFRTPNLFHYVTLASRFLPHGAHLRLANALRGLPSEAHDPWRTFYRANTPVTLRRLVHKADLSFSRLHLVEAEPSYGRASALLFFPMMAYERTVNSTERLAMFRSSINAVVIKPA